MTIDKSLFGLQKETKVVFLTPEEASKIGASSGYNAVYEISETRVRYELLQAGKALPPQSSKEDPKPVEKKKEAKKQKIEEPVKVEIKEEEPQVQPPVKNDEVEETTLVEDKGSEETEKGE
jgi:hypothetical protein